MYYLYIHVPAKLFLFNICLSFLSHRRDGLYFPNTPSSPYHPGGHNSPNRSPKKGTLTKYTKLNPSVVDTFKQ